ncbi:MAG: acetylornithine deacetylase [Sandaracinaceae bacterium]
MAKLSTREMIERLIAEPSVSAVDPALDMSNGPVIDHLANWLEHEGWSVERMPLADGKANLLATLGRGSGGLVLSGHSDTVPCDEHLWSSDPFSAEERDGRLYGLGSCDMKSFFALAIAAARRFSASDLKEPLMLLATADEETGMDGARALVEAGRPRARHAVIGEPTGLRPVRMHKGSAWSRLELTGRSGHSSVPSLGISALDGMHAALGAIMDVRQSLASRHQHPALTPPHPTLNLARVQGGDNPNRICGHCTLDYDIRVTPGLNAGTVRGEVEEAVATVLEGRGLRVAHSSLCPDVPPFETDASSALVQAVESLTGHASEGVSFGTEAPFLTQLGMQTVVLGPGDIDVAHQPDEFLPLERVAPMVDLLEKLVGRFCVEAS